MKSKVWVSKTNRWTVMEREGLPLGLWSVKLYASNGKLLDKVRVDNCRTAREYLKAFKAIARQ